MPIAQRLLLAALALLPAASAVAQSPEASAGRRVEAIAPALQGGAQAIPLNGGRRGMLGRPTRFGRLFVEMDIVSACTITATVTVPTVRCGGDLPFHAARSDQGEASLMEPAPARDGASGPHPRLTVTY